LSKSKGKKPLVKIKNVYQKYGDKIEKNPLFLVSDLSSLPIPEFDSNNTFFYYHGKLSRLNKDIIRNYYILTIRVALISVVIV